MYKLLQSGSVVDLTTGATIPVDPDNQDYQKYLAWVAEPNTPLPADPIPLHVWQEQPFQVQVETTNATPTELLRLPLQTFTGYTATALIIAVDAGNGATKVLRTASSFKRLGAGALQIGANTVETNHADTGTSAWVIGAAPNGNDFVVTVTGVAGRTINWSLSVDLVSFRPQGL